MVQLLHGVLRVLTAPVLVLAYGGLALVAVIAFALMLLVAGLDRLGRKVHALWHQG